MKINPLNNIYKLYFILVFSILLFTACDDDSTTYYKVDNTNNEQIDTTAFVKGADVSWITEMESNGYLFYDSLGNQTECMSLLKSLGTNAIRLRVWVNPTYGWCNKTDVLVKAKRASDLNMRIMIDFHYSDSWADPATQTKPSAWANIATLDELCQAVSDHTTDVLSALKDWGIYPEWVQIGNETTSGMLWDDNNAVSGYLTVNDGVNYTKLHNAGYDAAKAVFPNTKVVLHVDRGYNNDYSKRMLTTIIGNDNDYEDAKLDVFGLSLYPSSDNYATLDASCLENMQWIVDNYDLDVMICEVGMEYDDPEACKAFLTDIIAKTKSVVDSKGNVRGKGVFYWEPQCYNFKSYTKGAFDDGGKPTVALDAFKE